MQASHHSDPACKDADSTQRLAIEDQHRSLVGHSSIFIHAQTDIMEIEVEAAASIMEKFPVFASPRHFPRICVSHFYILCILLRAAVSINCLKGPNSKTINTIMDIVKQKLRPNSYQPVHSSDDTDPDVERDQSSLRSNLATGKSNLKAISMHVAVAMCYIIAFTAISPYFRDTSHSSQASLIYSKCAFWPTPNKCD